jgi:hypothetical protein
VGGQAPDAMNGRPLIRLAFRAEGEFVNAYHAAGDTMEGADLLGSFRRSLLDQQPGLFDAWKAIMSDAYAKLIESTLGIRPTMDETPAPEHERAGRG